MNENESNDVVRLDVNNIRIKIEMLTEVVSLGYQLNILKTIKILQRRVIYFVTLLSVNMWTFSVGLALKELPYTNGLMCIPHKKRLTASNKFCKNISLSVLRECAVEYLFYFKPLSMLQLHIDTSNFQCVCLQVKNDTQMPVYIAYFK